MFSEARRTTNLTNFYGCDRIKEVVGSLNHYYCPAADDTDTSLKNLKQSLIGKEKSRVKDGRVLAHLESVIVTQAQFHIIGRSPFQLSAARSRKLVCAYFSRWLEY